MERRTSAWCNLMHGTIRGKNPWRKFVSLWHGCMTKLDYKLCRKHGIAPCIGSALTCVILIFCTWCRLIWSKIIQEFCAKRARKRAKRAQKGAKRARKKSVPLSGFVFERRDSRGMSCVSEDHFLYRRHCHRVLCSWRHVVSICCLRVLPSHLSVHVYCIRLIPVLLGLQVHKLPLFTCSWCVRACVCALCCDCDACVLHSEGTAWGFFSCEKSIDVVLCENCVIAEGCLL